MSGERSTTSIQIENVEIERARTAETQRAKRDRERASEVTKKKLPNMF